MEFEFDEEILEATDDKAADRGDNLEEDGQGDDQEQAGNEGTGDQGGADGDEDAGEGDAQGDGEGEDGSGEDEAKAKGDKDKGHDHDQGDDPVPAARFREVIKQRNEVRDQIKAIQEQNRILMQTLESIQKGGGKTADGQQQQDGGQQAQGDQDGDRFKDFDLKAKMSAYNDAVIDGDDEAAKELFSEILDYQNHMTEQRVVATIQNLNRSRETEANRQLAVEIVERHSKELGEDPDLADDMAYYRARYERQGMTIKDALLAAEKKVFGTAGNDDGGGGEDGDDHGESPAERRKRQAIERNAAAAQNQPPLPTGGRGQRARTMPKNALELSDDEFDKLPEEERRKLRGDVV